MAHYTKRHIVSIPLSRIATNQDLTALFFNGTYTVAGSQKVAKLGFDNVIFVLVDVDAGSKVVISRELRMKEKQREEEEFRLRVAGMTGATMEGPAAVAVPRPAPVAPATSSLPLPTRIPPPRSSGMSSVRMDGDDDLDLTGILNVLDGVVDTPGRIVVMTTNFPELLDPALIRPGRIDRVMHLSYMLADDVIAMLEHYYQTVLSKDEKRRVRSAVNKGKEEGKGGLELVPARVEQLTMEKDCVMDMVGWLEAEAGITDGADCSATDSDSSSSNANPAKEHREQSGLGIEVPTEDAVLSVVKDVEVDPLALHLTSPTPSRGYTDDTLSFLDDEGDY